MQLISVNIGKEQPIQYAKETGLTGIFKKPVNTPVQIHTLGLEGDEINDRKNHGGPDQAVYVYGGADYTWWSDNLGRDLEAGTFGENLTISDLETGPLNVGDRIHVGSVVLEVTAARIPCVTLATRMDDPQFVKKFRAAERPGVYCRVIQTGTVCAGDAVTIEHYQGETLSIAEMFRLYYDKNISETDIRRHLAAPVAIRARRDNEERLAKLKA